MTVPETEHTTFDATASDAGWSCQAPTAGAVCTFELGTVEVGDLAEVLFAATLEATIPAGVDQIVNTAAVADDGLAATDPDPDPAAVPTVTHHRGVDR